MELNYRAPTGPTDVPLVHRFSSWSQKGVGPRILTFLRSMLQHRNWSPQALVPIDRPVSDGLAGTLPSVWPENAIFPDRINFPYCFD